MKMLTVGHRPKYAVFHQYALKADGQGDYFITDRGELYNPSGNIPTALSLETAVRLIRYYEQADKSLVEYFVSTKRSFCIL